MGRDEAAARIRAEVLAAVKAGRTTADEIARATGIRIDIVHAALVGLEIDDQIGSVRDPAVGLRFYLVD